MDTNTYLANLKVDDVVIDCDKLILDDPAIEDQKYNFAVDIQLQTNAIMHPGSTIDVEYPTNIMTQIDGEYRGYRVDKSELGTTTVTITNRNLSSIRLYFQTTKTVMQMVQYANRAYGVEISNVNITSESGIPVYSTSIPGIVSVKNQKKYVL